MCCQGAGVTRGRFFCHTSAALRWYKRTVPYVPPSQSKRTAPDFHQLSPKGAAYHYVAGTADSSRKLPGGTPGVSPVGGRSPLTGRFKGVQGGNRNPPWSVFPLCYFLPFDEIKREKVNRPRPPRGRTSFSPVGESPPPPLRADNPIPQ